ncbi:MAG: hypothetical protein ACLRZH_06220 [Ruthenibacterium lactatiformans]
MKIYHIPAAPLYTNTFLLVGERPGAAVDPAAGAQEYRGCWSRRARG